MPPARLRALVLAAGLGTRLRPLTDAVPKPLLPVAGLPILAHTLLRLAEAGCEAAAVNLHHHGEEIRRGLGEEIAGMPLTYSVEPELLGTGGALYPLRDFFSPAEHVLLVNGDSLCRWPFRRLLRRHRESGAAATLLLASRPDPAAFGGGVGIDREGGVLSFRGGDPARGEVARRLVFAGAHALDPALLARVGPGPSDVVRDLYQPLLAEGAHARAGRIGSVVTTGLWHDLGTPRRFLEASLDWSRPGWPERLWRSSWISPEAALASGARVRGSAVEGGVRVGERARVERSVLLPGSQVGEGSFLREVIVGTGASVPAGSWVERRLVTARRDGAPRGLADSVVEGAVYTPLDPEVRPAASGEVA